VDGNDVLKSIPSGADRFLPKRRRTGLDRSQYLSDGTWGIRPQHYDLGRTGDWAGVPILNLSSPVAGVS
jgi:hypothetical protein